MAEKTVSPERARKALANLDEALEDSERVREALAEGIVEQARRNAARRPTPQAPMAAAGLRVERGRIVSLPGASPAARVAVGSEFGSGIYRQFGPRHSRGQWLFPAIESPDAATIEAGEEAIDAELDSLVRRA